MLALRYKSSLELEKNFSKPSIKNNEALIKVKKAGICKTDIELVKGYMGFEGTLGHEFVGVVEACEDDKWIGRRVVGEINSGCGQCENCQNGLARHCVTRSVLGILNRDGCMAEYCSLPLTNLCHLPDSISDDEAVFTEPLSAACEILEQTEVLSDDRCVVLGDGKLGILIAWVLSTKSDHVKLIGRHEKKLELAKWNNLQTMHESEIENEKADIVVDATGSVNGLNRAMALCRPRGRIVLKSTFAQNPEIDLSPMVINEITMIGSRCGQFKDGLALIEKRRPPLIRLIEKTYHLEDGLQAFGHAQKRGVLKILLDMTIQ